ncbi:MAG: putative toxin-antitoxin system toxin component, PIN family [Dysgonamonadaceae bacterium]|jgi:putative PIN family toxin of toxin-antitoxin system|nr:putative toxin-antitoxin system toxin component, PIN family [Dysgonamonadaceae bacterium]
MEKYKIIIDTNLWISLLIGKRLSELRFLCNNESISVYICDELKAEFLRIASREKIRKYTTEERITHTLELMEASCVLNSITNKTISPYLRDAKDLYLLALADTVKADYILTGDKDLLILHSHHKTKIVTYKEFETIINQPTKTA